MLKSAKDVMALAIGATDGHIGKVKDLYFDDQTWTVRYFVVDTGGWLSGRKVLISPTAVGEPDWKQEVLPVSLTRRQVADSPDIDLELPVNRQAELDLAMHYGWATYWGSAPRALDPTLSDSVAAEATRHERRIAEQEAATHLRSAADVLGYHVHATDGRIGHVNDFLLDTDHWAVRYAGIDTSNFLGGREALIAIDWLQKVDWADELLWVALNRQQIKASPDYHRGQPVTREYETRLHEYYGQPKYWKKS